MLLDPPPHGWLNIDKPLGLSSAQVVAAVKRLLRGRISRQHKVGHGGTLDPLATGVLPIALGEATKLTGYMLGAQKGYAFTISFGARTSTADAEGEIVARSDLRPTYAAIAALLPHFTGPLRQVPPAYSALMVDGERAYARARAGEAVELAARDVIVYELRVLDREGEQGNGDINAITLTALVSKGTYIRSLAQDIATALGTEGHVSLLRRTKAGPFGLDSAISLDKLQALILDGALEQALLPLTAGLDDIPALAITPDQAMALKQGKSLFLRPDQARHSAHPGTYMAMNGSVPIALVAIQGAGVSVLRGFNL